MRTYTACEELDDMSDELPRHCKDSSTTDAKEPIGVLNMLNSKAVPGRRPRRFIPIICVMHSSTA